LRPFHFALCTIVVLFPMFAAACAGSNLPPVAVEPTESSVQAPPTHPANTPLPATTIEPGPTCTEIGQTWTSPADGVILVCVPAGEFLMGAADNDPLAQDHEKPQHRVYLNAFWIDRTEVTNANFAKCMAAGACRPKVYERSAMTYTPYAIHPEYQDYPAFLYEADVADAYCRWARRRLPTEAEWEKAARGTDGRSYPWGNKLDCTKASYYACDNTPKTSTLAAPKCPNSARCQTTRVDDYLAGASPYGALNMVGNVWEWVADWYSPVYYAHSPTTNPTGPDAGEFKVRRGGGAKSLPQDLRVTSRASGSPQHYFDDQMGFRCAASVFTP
jgi:formylglycine-generating enzyme required for sulfatase activity